MRRPLPGLAVVASLLLGAVGAHAEEPTPGKPIAPAELASRLEAGDAPFVLDVRTREEYVSGHIPGSTHVPHDVLAERLEELPEAKSEEIVVHCQSGRRAALAEEVLLGAGYTNVRDLTGHWQAWQDAGLPVAPGAASTP